MTTKNNGSNCGYNSEGTTSWKTGGSTATATLSDLTCGSTFSVNEIPSPGCYACHWNGSLLRVSDAAFTSGGFTSFNFTSSDPMTVTYLTNDPTATIENCRTWADGANVYCNF
jgi:Zn-dependent M28 family amino/carboxypeptidase